MTARANTWDAGAEACTVVRTLAAGATTTIVHCTGRQAGKNLALDASCDQPLVTAFEAAASPERAPGIR